MGKNRRRAMVNLTVSLCSYIISIVVGLLIPRLFAYNYGSETNGLISSVSQFITYLGLFEAGIGAATLQALYKPVAKGNRESVSSIMQATNVYYRKAGIFYLIGLCLLSLIYPLCMKIDMPYWETAGIILLNGAGYVLNFWIQGKYLILLEAEGRKYVNTYITMAYLLISGALKIVLIKLHFNVLFIFFLSFLINCISIVYLLSYIKKHYNWLDKKAKADFKALDQRNYALVHQISSLVFSNTDIIILTAFCGLKIVSVYTMYKLVVIELGKFISILPNSVSFSLGQLFSVDKKAFERQIDNLESAYSVLFHTIYSVCLYLFLPFMVLYTEGIRDINYIDGKLAVLFVAIEILSSARIPMLNTINYAGHFRDTSGRAILETIINLLVSLVGVRYLGIYGVLLGTVAALLFRTNDIIIYANHRILKRSCLKTYAIHLINLFVLIVSQKAYAYLFPAVESYFEFLFCGLILTAGTGLAMMFLQMLFFPQFRKYINWGVTLLVSKIVGSDINEDPDLI